MQFLGMQGYVRFSVVRLAKSCTCNNLYMLQEETLKQKQQAKKEQQQQQQKSSTNNADTADSSHAAAASAGTAASLPADKTRAAAEPAPHTSTDKGKGHPRAEDGGSVGSPFACVSAILGWETFHMVHVLWIGLVDLPGKAPEKDWEMQVGIVKPSCLADYLHSVLCHTPQQQCKARRSATATVPFVFGLSLLMVSKAPPNNAYAVTAPTLHKLSLL